MSTQLLPSYPVLASRGSRRSFSAKGSLRNEETKPSGKLQEEIRLRKLVSPLAAAILTLSTPYFINTQVSLAEVVDFSKGAELFEKACIGCHVGGGNIIQPGATLFMKDLLRNNSATEEDIYNITYSGKGRMPGYGEKCTPRGQCTFGARLQDEEIRLLAKFIKSQAENGWPNIEINTD